MDKQFEVNEEKGVAIITLVRQETYNTLTLGTLTALKTLLHSMATSNSIRVIVIGAEGKAFSTGHDLKEIGKKSEKKFLKALFSECTELMLSIQRQPQPVIAQVQGIATAAGCQLVASCDLVVASRKAQFATNGINNGLYCATPSVALSRTIQPKHALEMLLTGDFIDAERAMQLGLVNKVVDEEFLRDETLSLAENLASKSNYALQLGKRSFYNQIGLNLEQAYQTTSNELITNILSVGGQEGIRAFIEKRSPKWKKTS
tara:strand:+ start:1114 stop:1893 length:780 start_codon:yes stop_codon:yes gene_type:complete